ncbi:hypothetical protein FQZ97_972630 [compost metagenome]
MAAVEDRDVARRRHLLVDAPERVVRALGFGGRFPAHGVHAQRTGLAEDAADRAVLARGVGALQHDQQLVAAVSVEQVLQRVDLKRQGLHPRLVRALVALRKRLDTRVHGLERDGAPGLAVLAMVAGHPRVDLPVPPAPTRGSDQRGLGKGQADVGRTWHGRSPDGGGPCGRCAGD